MTASPTRRIIFRYSLAARSPSPFLSAWVTAARPLPSASMALGTSEKKSPGTSPDIDRITTLTRGERAASTTVRWNATVRRVNTTGSLADSSSRTMGASWSTNSVPGDRARARRAANPYTRPKSS